MKEFIADSFKYPKEVHFESSSRCNAKCITCPREGMTRQQGEMPNHLFVKGIDEMKEAKWEPELVHFHLNGEPLFLPIGELCWRIKYAEQHLPKGTTFCLFTNASMLTPEVSERLLDSPLGFIVFSIDAGNKEAYARSRPGLDWDKMVCNIAEFMRIKVEKGSLIKTQTSFIPHIHNQDSLPDYYRLFNSLGILDVGGGGIVNIGGMVDAKKLRLGGQYTKGNIDAPCWRVFRDIDIMSDGRVCVCCQDVQGKLVLGDLNKETLPEIWQGEKFETVRKVHLSMNRESIPHCKDCDYMEGFVPDEWWPK